MNIAMPQRNIMAARALDGKVSLVTGSTSGIGLGIARALAASGSAIVLNGFGKSEEIAATQSQLADQFGVQVQYSPADMSKADAIEQMIADALTSFGRLDIVVNNAGIQHVAPIAEFPVEKWQAILAIDLSSAFHTTRCALPAMRAHGWGRIINIASAHGLVASPFKSAYVAAKHGLVGLTKVTALETAEEGITCNAICPGYVFTPLVARRRSRHRPRLTTFPGSRWCATCSWPSSRTRSSRRSRRWEPLPCSWRATPRLRSPV
jgi:3-hydroxybutyrate dehydrogenase